MIALTRFAPLAFLPLALAACEQPMTVADKPMAASSTGTGTASMPAGLTAEERFLWGTMTPEAQAQAADYIANGGKLKQFMAI